MIDSALSSERVLTKPDFIKRDQRGNRPQPNVFRFSGTLSFDVFEVVGKNTKDLRLFFRNWGEGTHYSRKRVLFSGWAEMSLPTATTFRSCKTLGLLLSPTP